MPQGLVPAPVWRLSAEQKNSTDLNVPDKEDLFFEDMNQEGEKVVSKGYARVSD